MLVLGANPSSLAATEQQWGFNLPKTGDYILLNDQRYLHIMPAQGPAFKKHLPFFLRAGIHLTHIHKTYHYLTHQALSLWGHTMQRPALELSWPQVQQLFAGNDIILPAPVSLKGEIICRLGAWTICRALVKNDRQTVQGMVPKSTRRQILNILSELDIQNIGTKQKPAAPSLSTSC